MGALYWGTLSFHEYFPVCEPCTEDFEYLRIFPCVWALYRGTLSFHEYLPVCEPCTERLWVFKNISLCVGPVLGDFEFLWKFPRVWGCGLCGVGLWDFQYFFGCVWVGAWDFAFEKHSLCVGPVPKDFEIFQNFSLYWGTLPNFEKNPCVWGSDGALAQ